MSNRLEGEKRHRASEHSKRSVTGETTEQDREQEEEEDIISRDLAVMKQIQDN